MSGSSGRMKGLISSSGRNCQWACLRATTSLPRSQPLPLQGLPPALPAAPFTQAWHRPPSGQPGRGSHTCPPGQSRPGGQGPTARGSEKSHFSPLGGHTWPLPSLSTRYSLDQTVPQGRLWVPVPKTLGLLALSIGLNTRLGLGPVCCFSLVPDPLAPKLGLGKATHTQLGQPGAALLCSQPYVHAWLSAGPQDPPGHTPLSRSSPEIWACLSHQAAPPQRPFSQETGTSYPATTVSDSVIMADG